MRAFALCAALVLALVPGLHAQGETPAPLSLLDVPFLSQSEALCGGAAAAMVLRYWGERGVSAESFAHLLDRDASGIRTGALVEDLRRRGWRATGIAGREDLVRGELSRGRPVLTLIEDRPAVFHYIVVLAWHERGVVFHDPARAPFRVMTRNEFQQRWDAAKQWMAVVVPGEVNRGSGAGPPTGSPPGADPRHETNSTCDQLVADGVGRARSDDLDGAERALASALGCPGPAAARELAGVRLLQKRWTEVADLASAAVAEDPRDAYAWKLLATARFVQDDRLGALDAWNRAGEPRLDLLRVDGLARTRHRVVERMLAVRAGEVVTKTEFVRARRQLAELPSATSSRLDYIPVPAGLAELRASVAERPLLPRDRLSLAALGLSAAVDRELRVTSGSFTGGGEQLWAAWRFWPHRPRLAVGIRTPAPWRGVWSVEASTERQPFTSAAVPRADRGGAQVRVSDWATGRLRWNLAGGLDRWHAAGTFGTLGGGIRLASLDDRIDSGVQMSGWLNRARFATVHASVRARSSITPRATVILGSVAIEAASEATPPDLWFAGDTGHARPTLLRAHPALDGGRLRVDRLGRTLLQASLETQRWWQVAAALRIGGAVFADVGRLSRRLEGPPQKDVDAGLGARVAVAGMPGVFRVDLARGLRDGAAALSFVYEP